MITTDYAEVLHLHKPGNKKDCTHK